ncbi:MAG: corrinoid protein [Deltaproteobacteria bacterium]|nr:corrinoid protein [Deltaproteobacteria bacterium]MBW2070051.1 corrinoid protein [Deltaproteobacteria bacterium]
MIDEKLLKAAKQAIIEHNKEKAVELTRSILSSGMDGMELMNQVFIPAINEVGDKFGRGLLFLPELVQSADAMQAVTEVINESLPAREARKQTARVVLATVKGDVHDIGKCIVTSLMQANGFTVYDLGRDVDIDHIVEEAVRLDVQIIGTSALLTTTMARQKDLEDALKSAGVRDRFKTIVGGAPVTARWAAKIGADAYAEDAQEGVVRVKELLAG